MSIGNNSLEEFEDDYEDSQSKKQMWEDVYKEMANQGLTAADFPEGIDPGIFVDVDSYDE